MNKRCNGYHRTAEGDRALIALATKPRGLEAKTFVAAAIAVEPSLGSKPYNELVNDLIKMLTSISKTCPKCKAGAD